MTAKSHPWRTWNFSKETRVSPTDSISSRRQLLTSQFRNSQIMSWEDADNKLHTEEISHCVTVIQQSQQGWQVRRAALLHLYDGNVHQHPSVNLESFAQFLKINFPKKFAITRKK